MKLKSSPDQNGLEVKWEKRGCPRSELAGDREVVAIQVGVDQTEEQYLFVV